MLGYIYVKHRGKGRIASSFIPVIEEGAEEKSEETENEKPNGNNEE